jgi:predicted peroxiredoxin
MTRTFRWLLVFAALMGGSFHVVAQDKAPLFVNLTSDEPHRAAMGLMFGKNQLERGHKLTVFLNDRAVHLGAKSNAGKFGGHQKTLADLMAKGATILICPFCMQHYGVKEGDLVPGLKIGNAELTGGALFEPNARSLTW